MVAVNEIRDEYRLEAKTDGVEQAKAAAEGLASATDKITVASEKQERKVISVQRALEKFAAANDQAFRAQQQVERAQALVNRAFEQGLGESLAYQRATVVLADKQAALARITAQSAVANDNNAASLARMRAQYDPIFAAQLRHRTALEGISEAERAGAITATTAMQARIAATRAMEDQISKLERLARAQKEAAQRQVNQQLIVPDRGADIAAYAAEMDRLRAKFDPLFAAQTAYRSGLAELRQALATGAISEAAYTVELDRRKAAFAEQVRGLGLVSAAERAAAAAAQETARATQAAANAAAAAAAKARAQGIVSGQTVTVDRGADVADYGRQLDALRAKYNPLFAAGQAYKAQLLEIAQAARVGALTEAERAAAITRTKETFAKQVESIRSNSGAIAINANQWQNLGFQINDVFTSLSSGAPVMQVIAQQSGQIYQALDGPKGVVGGLKEVGNFLLGLLTPARLAVGGLAALGVTAIAAAMSWRSTQAEVRQALAGIGRAAGVTASELEGIAIASAAASNTSVGAARSLALELAKTGKIARDNLAPITALGKNFAATLGLDATEGNAQLARSFAEPGKGAEDLARRYGLLSDATVRYIQHLEDSNERGRAQQVLIDALRPKLVNAAELTTGWAYAWDRVSTAARNAWDWIGKATDKAMGGTGGGSDEEVRKALEERLRYQQSAAGRAASSRGGDLEASNRAIAETQRQLTALEQRTAKARTDAQDASKNELSLRAGLIARSVAPELQALDELRAKRKTLADDMANQGAGPGMKDQAVALARLDAQIRDFTQAGGALELQERKRAAASQIVLDALKARTPAEVGAIAARKALNDAEGTATFQAERNAQAERERTQAAAAAQKALDDQSGAVQRNTEGNNRVADAWRVSSEAGALYAESVRKASEDVETRGLPADRKLAQQQAYLREQLSEQIKERARAIAQKNQEAAVDENLARLVDKQVVSTEQAAQQRQRDLDVARLQGLAAVAEGDQRTALLRQVDDLTAAYGRENAVRAERAAQGMIADQERELAMLRLETELVGKSAIERERALAVLRAQQELQRQGIALSSEKGQSYIDNAAMLSDIRTARTQFERLAQDVSSVVSGIFDDMFKAGNKGLAGFFDSFARGFARIGTRILEQNLIAPLVTSAMGGGSGTAGAGASLFGGFDFSKIEKAVSEGSFSGIMESFGDLLKPGADSKGGGFASSKLGGGLLSAGVGASIGYQSQSPLVGALGGAASGFTMGGPVGGVVGGIAGLLGGLFGKDQAKKAAAKKLKEQLEAYKEAYKQAEPEIKKLEATFRGESLGNVGGQIDAAFQQAVQANKTASQAGDQKRADSIMIDFTKFAFRLRDQFMNAFEGTLAEAAAGFGASGPFAQANAAVSTLGESLKAFVEDAKSLPDAEANTARARAAAQQAALAALDPPKALSDTQSRLAAIQGTATGLSRVLQDLGMSADEAAAAIRDRTTKAMDALRAQFSADLGAKINDAAGKSYLNDIADLVKERDGLLADARAIGADTAQVGRYFTLAAQKIVDGSELTGAAFADLVKRFPALKGAVVEFGQAVDTAAAKAEAAARALGYQDRAFAAGNDTGTLAGALAAQDRKAAQDRAAEAKAGGRAMADLEKALAAERTAIIKDFAARAAEAEAAAREAGARRILSAEDRLFAARNDASTLAGKLAETDRQHAQERLDEAAAGGQAMAKLVAAQAAERLKIVREAGAAEAAARKAALAEAQTFLDGATKSIRVYLDGLKTGADTALSPGDRLAEAQKQFDAQLALAKGGDRDAMSGITQYASNLLDAGRANFASGEGYQSILAAVQQSLGDLPSQVSAEQFIVDAITKSTTDLGTAIAANNPAAIATALDANFSKLDTNLDGRLSSAEFIVGLGPLATAAEQAAARAIFDRIDQNGDGLIDAQEKARFDLVAAIEANRPELIQRALSAEFDKLDGDGSGGLTEAEFLKGLGPLATATEQAAARAYFKAIDEDGNGIIDRVELMRGQLKTAIEANRPGLIEAALRANFDKIDTTANGLLDKGELIASLGPLATAQQQTDALAVFKRIDTNGDGQISKQELIRSQLKAAIEANSPSAIQKALALDFAKLDALDANTKGSLTIAEFKAGLGPLATKAEQDAAEVLFRSMDENGDGLLSKTELMRGQLKTAIEANTPAAIATALNANFSKLDTTMNGRLDEKEFLAGLGTLATKEQADAAKKVFDAIDKDGDGQISKLEAVLFELKTNLGSPTAIATALNDNFKMLDRTSDKALDLTEFTAAIGPLATKADQLAAKAVFDSIDKDGDGLITKMEMTRSDLETAIKANSAGAIATALNTNFTTLADKTKGGITKAQFDASIGPLATKAEQAAAYKVFQAIDADGNGIITKTEAVRAELLGQLKLNDPTKIASALNANFSTLTAATNGRLTSAQLVAGLGPLATKADQAAALTVFKSIDADGNGIITKLEAVSGAIVTAVKANNATAFAAEIDKSFSDLDTRVDGLLDQKELAAAISGLSTNAEIQKANAWLKLMDADNDGFLSKQEVIRARMVDTAKNTSDTKGSVDGVKTNTGTGNVVANENKKLLQAISELTRLNRKTLENIQVYNKQQKEFLDAIRYIQDSSYTVISLSKDSLDVLKTSSGTQEATLKALEAQFAPKEVINVYGIALNSNMVTALNKIVYNTGRTVEAVRANEGNKFQGFGTYASGGWVNGPGTGTSDSIAARLSNGEFVVNAASARMNAGLLEALNDNRTLMMPAVPVPVPVAAGGGGDVVAELRALRAEVARLRSENRSGQEMQARVTKAGADKVTAATEGVREEVSDHRTDDNRRERKVAGVAGGRG